MHAHELLLDFLYADKPNNLEEDQPFEPCYPAPISLDPNSTSQFVGWYGVLFAYANHTSALLQDEELPQEVLNKLNFTLKMIQKW